MRLATKYHLPGVFAKSKRIRPLENASPPINSNSIALPRKNSEKKNSMITPGLKFERISSPHIFASETTTHEESDKNQTEYPSLIAERVKKNLEYPEAGEASPYEHLPLQRRVTKNLKALEKVEGNFHCRGCNNRYHSHDVWVTRSTRKCVQSTECPKCYTPNMPYYLHQQEQSIFSSRGVARVKRTKKGNWVRVSPTALRKLG
mmetsp:Transcript_40041/g.63304  ORF Transcript_40041/g.63304 Transcript_40041/m.63304 type:complete len:204 (-) Transcript_40041:105-716(-)